MKYTYDYARPAVSADNALFGIEDGTLKLLLIERGRDPFKGFWALPGGFVEIDEDLETAAARELQEETGLTKVAIQQLATFGAVNRDPRTRVINVSFIGFVTPAQMKKAVAGDDASDTHWFEINDLPKLAFDHKEVVALAKKRLKLMAQTRPIGKPWLPAKFHFQELANAYEFVMEKKIKAKSLKKQLLKLQVIVAVDEAQDTFRFDAVNYRKLQDDGINLKF